MTKKGGPKSDPKRDPICKRDPSDPVWASDPKTGSEGTSGIGRVETTLSDVERDGHIRERRELLVTSQALPLLFRHTNNPGNNWRDILRDLLIHLGNNETPDDLTWENKHRRYGRMVN